MESTARALLISLSYLELWSDEVINPDVALSAIESITSELDRSTKEEIEVISKVASDLASESSNDDEKEFYEGFAVNFLSQ